MAPSPLPTASSRRNDEESFHLLVSHLTSTPTPIEYDVFCVLSYLHSHDVEDTLWRLLEHLVATLTDWDSFSDLPSLRPCSRTPSFHHRQSSRNGPTSKRPSLPDRHLVSHRARSTCLFFLTRSQRVASHRSLACRSLLFSSPPNCCGTCCRAAPAPVSLRPRLAAVAAGDAGRTASFPSACSLVAVRRHARVRPTSPCGSICGHVRWPHFRSWTDCSRQRAGGGGRDDAAIAPSLRMRLLTGARATR